MQTRIYVVAGPDVANTDQPTKFRLIRAASPASAIRHAIRGNFDVRAASVNTVADLMAQGVAVENASSGPIGSEDLLEGAR